MNGDNEKIKEQLKKEGYMTVDILIERLQALSERGLGNEMVGNEDSLYKHVRYDRGLDVAVIC